MKLVTAAQMRELDKRSIGELGIPGIVLMENAGAGGASIIMETLHVQAADGVCIVCGTGNNGGDGFVIARHLWNNGYEVEIYIIGEAEQIKGDARINYEIAEKFGLPITEVTGPEEMDILRQDLTSFGLIVDALFGTGLDREVRGIFREVIEAINEAQTKVFSVDIPSGLNSDTGQPMGVAVFADLTGTFAYAKVGQFTYPGYLYCGDVYIVDISIPGFFEEDVYLSTSVLDTDEFFHLFAPRSSASHKGDFGHLLVVGGYPGMTGAPALSSLAALRCGAGLCTLAVPKDLNLAMEAKLTEVMTKSLTQTEQGGLSSAAASEIRALLKGKTALALGPGMGTSEEARRLLADLLPAVDVNIVIDADGLNNLVGQLDLLRRCPMEVILTPHPGEMARLTGKTTKEVMSDRVGVARSFAEKNQVYVVLKGARSVVAAPDGRVWINVTGNPGMATAGAGDVLTGVIAGLLAQPFKPLDCVLAGTYIHGQAGDLAADRLGEKGLIASDILNDLPAAIKSIEDFYYAAVEGAEGIDSPLRAEEIDDGEDDSE
jgi:ADP-dependent NAD(P)H-hydrate dehydratase / NAD(P)H-hydrate epimerase